MKILEFDGYNNKKSSFGQSGFQVIENGGTTQFYVGNGITFIKFDGVDIGTERLTASGSSINRSSKF